MEILVHSSSSVGLPDDFGSIVQMFWDKAADHLATVILVILAEAGLVILATVVLVILAEVVLVMMGSWEKLMHRDSSTCGWQCTSVKKSLETQTVGSQNLRIV